MRLITILLLAFTLTCSCTSDEDALVRRAAKIHRKALTVDSHVDTPLWLTRPGYNFMERHDATTQRNKLDLPRMIEGGLDGVFFAVFIGQEARDSAGNNRALLQAQMILDTIYTVSGRNAGKMEIVNYSGDFKKVNNSGKQAIFLGLENGYPIGRDLAQVDSFYRKGIRYITLCHTRNNDICDSSTDTLEHNGISPFGREVIARMNDLGIMVDMSHASDSSFYQALDLSRTPIIASHSCARALCDNPRNLTDDMLMKLKENGGVIQMCILSDYVKTPEPNPARDSARQAVVLKHGDYYTLDDARKEAFLEDWYRVDVDFPRQLANVQDVVDHIDHIVSVAGIDHVGIGTDFDGGGGVEGCFDVSEMGNITLELVKRGYSEKDIEKIWSGNLMRVMQAVEDQAI